MPNHVANNVIVTGSEHAIETFLARCFRVIGPDGGEPDFSFEAIMPSGTPEVSAENEAKEHNDRRRRLWGTKWDAWDTAVLYREAGYLHFEFITALSYPKPVYRALGRAFPTLTFDVVALEGSDRWAASAWIEGEQAEFDETVDPRSIYERIYEQPFDEMVD